MYLYGDFGNDYWDTGSVKKVPSALSIVHDCSKCNNDIVAELQSALSHVREYRVTNDLTSRILNPFQVLSLFRRMCDEVDIYIYLDAFWICFSFSFPFEQSLLFSQVEQFVSLCVGL